MTFVLFVCFEPCRKGNAPAPVSKTGRVSVVKHAQLSDNEDRDDKTTTGKRGRPPKKRVDESSYESPKGMADAKRKKEEEDVDPHTWDNTKVPAYSVFLSLIFRSFFAVSGYNESRRVSRSW